MVVKMRVTFEDGRTEDFDANDVIYANSGGLILSSKMMKPAKRFNLQAARWEEGMEMSSELRQVIAPPRPDRPATENWARVGLVVFTDFGEELPPGAAVPEPELQEAKVN